MKKNKYIKQVKDTIKLGVTSQVGLGTMGAIGSIPGMPKNNVIGIAGTAFNLANIGNMANIGMNMFTKNKKKK